MQQNDVTHNVDNPLAVMQPGEKVLLEIKRSNVGLIPIYITGIIAILLLAALTIFIPQIVPDISSQLRTLLLAFFGAVALLILIFVYVSVTVYKANRWIVTSDSLTQISQASLFHRHASQLGLANLEDVTTDQHGLMQAIFHYGTLIVETAGERSKFTFTYCPNPTYYAQQILLAHENYINTEPEATKRSNLDIQLPPSSSS